MDSITIKLSTPIQIGKEGEPITELVLKPTARAFRDCEIPMREDGTICFRVYDLARIGMKLAGQHELALEKMDTADMMRVATAVMGFLGTSPKTGIEL